METDRNEIKPVFCRIVDKYSRIWINRLSIIYDFYCSEI